MDNLFNNLNNMDLFEKFYNFDLEFYTANFNNFSDKENFYLENRNEFDFDKPDIYDLENFFFTLAVFRAFFYRVFFIALSKTFVPGTIMLIY